MESITLHLHLIAAVAWIGGSIFLFVLGLALRNKEDQKIVYPRIGPIYGYFELVMLVVLLISGYILIAHNGLSEALSTEASGEVVSAMRFKLVLVGVMMFLTLIHTVISFKTLHTEKTKLQTLFSRGSSLGILILNFWVLHYSIVLRDSL